MLLVAQAFNRKSPETCQNNVLKKIYSIWLIPQIFKVRKSSSLRNCLSLIHHLILPYHCNLWEVCKFSTSTQIYPKVLLDAMSAWKLLRDDSYDLPSKLNFIFKFGFTEKPIDWSLVKVDLLGNINLRRLGLGSSHDHWPFNFSNQKKSKNMIGILFIYI